MEKKPKQCKAIKGGERCKEKAMIGNYCVFHYWIKKEEQDGKNN